MKLGVLTSSRADYGIYRHLLQKLKEDSFFELEIIAFGMHLSYLHGLTIKEIEKDGYNKIATINSLISSDTANGIATSYALTALKFADFWNDNKYAAVFCLGDRFEMSAAVQAGIPYNMNFIHLHGGETTLGAIDNIYRHQITLASNLHFVSTDSYKDKVRLLTKDAEIYNVGSLSLDEINEMDFLNRKAFLGKFGIPDEDFALITFHPETMAGSDANVRMASEMKKALVEISKKLHLVITMPNADTLGSVYREEIFSLKEEVKERLTIIENFGKLYYFNAMKHSRIMIGNTSSGIIEAASFGKYVINVGDRQKGRMTSPNVIHCDFKATQITDCTLYILNQENYSGSNIYYKSGASNKIISVLKENYAKS